MFDGSGNERQVVLVVDDDSRVRSYVRAVLEKAGFAILEAKDGRDALDLMRALHLSPDVVVTDIHMPRMNGLELAKVLSAEIPALPLIFISGEETACTPLVQKPFSPQDLLDAVHQMLQPVPAR